MSDFNEWYKSNDCGLTAKGFFEAGAQSRQAEIEELQAMYEKQGLYAFELQETVSDQLLVIGQLEKKIEQLKCRHFWIGKSENQYCSKCGMID